MTSRVWFVRSAMLLSVVLLLVTAVGCGTSSQSDSSFRRFVGKWVNTQRTQAYSMLVIKRDHVMQQFVRSDAPTRAATLEIRKTWVDAEGGTCCQFKATDECYGHVIGLMRVDTAGKVLEYNIKPVRDDGRPWPEKIDPRAPMGDWVQYLVFNIK
jgi:hypothetical protein